MKKKKETDRWDAGHYKKRRGMVRRIWILSLVMLTLAGCGNVYAEHTAEKEPEPRCIL